MAKFFNRRKSNGKISRVTLPEDKESGKLAVKNEFIITFIKIIFAFVFLLIGAYLTYRGITASEYSIVIQFSTSSSIKFTDTPAGVILLVLSIFLLWKTKQDVKIGK
jgi:hypothetical protein